MFMQSLPGKWGTSFYSFGKNSGFHKNIPLIVVENMVYDDMVEDVAGLDLELYSAGTWSRTDENARNTEFVKKFESNGGQAAMFLRCWDMKRALP